MISGQKIFNEIWNFDVIFFFSQNQPKSKFNYANGVLQLKVILEFFSIYVVIFYFIN